MSDAAHSTVSSFGEELAHIMANGFPPVGDLSDGAVREKVQELAMATAYAWLIEDFAAQDAFLDEILAMNLAGAGVSLAVEAFTAIRLLGVPAGAVRSDTTITLRWPVPTKPMDRDGGNYDENVAIVTDLWTGTATGDQPRADRAAAQLQEMPAPQTRDVLRIMAFDTAKVMEMFAECKTAAADSLERYRDTVAFAGQVPVATDQGQRATDGSSSGPD